ncbi:MAG: hypothetical protein VR65_16980 [Desulfobulbaceae bacterium BRH_c16a]|nr:MAG: hypothetical protein VR65_16980 [Desulfobulbaceae bacterium BRH_c16a]
MADTLLYLDIHKDTIAAVVVDRSTKTSLVTGCGVVETAEQTFAAAIDRIKELTGFVSGSCVVTCGAELFSFRNLSLPFTERKKIEQVLPFELEDRLPIEMKSMVVDFTAKEGSHGSDIIAAMMNREYLADILAVLNSRGIDPDSIGISGLSTGLKIAEDGEANFVLIDIGTQWATVFIIIDRQIALIRSLGIPVNASGQNGTAETFFLSVKQTLLASRLVDMNSPDFCVYLAGNADRWGEVASLPPRLDGVEIRKYELHTRRSIQFQADTGMHYQPEIMDRVLVAALKGGARNRVFDFRKDEFKKRKSPREFRHLLVKIAAPLVFAAVALIGYGVYEYTHLLAQQEQLRSEIHGVFRETVPEISRIVNPVQQLQVINNQIGATYKPGGNERAGITIIDLLAELSSRIPASYQVKVVRLLADADTLRFKAITGNFNTVDNIQKELGKSPYFKNVVISSANQSSQNDEVTFELKLELARK